MKKHYYVGYKWKVIETYIIVNDPWKRVFIKFCYENSYKEKIWIQVESRMPINHDVDSHIKQYYPNHLKLTYEEAKYYCGNTSYDDYL